MGIVVKSAIALGAVYIAMFGNRVNEGKLTRAATIATCSALASARPVALQSASGVSCADTLSAHARDLLLAKYQAASLTAENRAMRSFQTLTHLDLAEPWSGPTAFVRQKIQKRGRVAQSGEPG